jgi:quinol-cytochrome oxidoreductase complex cytochrome b subunit
MSGPSSYEPKTAFERWLDARLPILRFNAELMEFPTPKNLNYWWTFGGILAFCLATQIVTGIVLAMHYNASGDGAFLSIQHIMRDVNYGWLVRYIHASGASMFFLAAYIHIFRGIYYGSFKAPREVLWLIGCAIYVAMMATAFFGYVLVWGQMSFWGAKVITNIFGAIPVVGPSLATWIWGGFTVDSPTLNRFFSLHYLFPFIIAGLVVLHVWALHVPGNNNPTGVNVKSKSDTVPFHPYYTVKDGFAISLFLVLYAVFVFYMPTSLMDVSNSIPANPLATPPQIVPEWYLLPFYAILRAIPDKLMGVIALAAAIGCIFALPWLDTSRVRSMRYRPQAKVYFLFLVVDCLILGFCGHHEPDQPIIRGLGGFELLDGNINSWLWLSRLSALYYFVYFLVITPLLGLRETPLPVPESISTPVLSHPAAAPAGAPAAPEHKG